MFLTVLQLADKRFRIRKLLASGIVLFLAVSAVPVQAQEEHELAMVAYTHGDFEKAASLWRALAKSGDALAQYNLGQLYFHGKGVNQDANVARYWLSQAARQGLSQAYAMLSDKALAPTQAPQTNADFELDPRIWIKAQDPKFYTLQLASSTNEHLIKKYFEENQLEGLAGYYRSRRSGEDWYALVYGAFPSAAAAKEAIDELPEDLRKWSPWVRNIRAIQKIMLD